MDTALRVFSFVGLGMGGKFMGEGVSRFKTEWGQKDCAGRSPQKTKHLQRLIPSHRAVAPLRGSPLLLKKETEKKRHRPMMDDHHGAVPFAISSLNA